MDNYISKIWNGSIINEKNAPASIVILNIILKFPMLFINTYPSDIDFYRSTGKLLTEGYIPYIDFEKYVLYDQILYINKVHPNGPFNYIFYAVVILFLGGSVFSIKLPMFLAEIGCAYFLFKIGLIITGNIKRAYYLAVFYSIIPQSYYPMLLVGCDEVITSFLTLAGIYYFYENRPYYSGLLIGLGTFYKYYPIFLLVPLIIGAYAGLSSYRLNLIKMGVIIICVFIVLSLPYLLINYRVYFRWLLIQGERAPTISYSVIFGNPSVYEEINILGITLSYFNLIRLPILGFTVIIIYVYYRKYLGISNGNRAASIIDNTRREFPDIYIFGLYTIFLPLLSLSCNYRYLFWGLPFVILALFMNEKRIREKKIKQLIKWTVILNGIIIFLIYIDNFLLPIEFITIFSVGKFLNMYIFLFFGVFTIWSVLYLKFSIFGTYKSNILFILGVMLEGAANLLAYLGLFYQSFPHIFGQIYILFYMFTFLFIVPAVICLSLPPFIRLFSICRTHFTNGIPKRIH